jgi:hypothetical protein
MPQRLKRVLKKWPYRQKAYPAAKEGAEKSLLLRKHSLGG